MQDVAARLHEGAVQPSKLPMIGTVRHDMKRYPRNNRTLWCFKEAIVEAVEVFMSSGLLSRLAGSKRLYFDGEEQGHSGANDHRAAGMCNSGHRGPGAKCHVAVAESCCLEVAL